MLTPRDASALLGVHPDTLARWCEEATSGPLVGATRRLPSGHRRYREDAILAYARSLERAA